MLLTGREVCIGKDCARGLEYGPRPKALKTKGTVFSYTDRPRPVNNLFIYFFLFGCLLFKLGKRDRREGYEVTKRVLTKRLELRK